ncbi:hypothetical protein J2776_004317 [Paraburkholderia caledonica]|uniref:Uncharacterized protein n=1 Tax=Paraburkholderia caledonica TaxID=134536 RepID=A0ABU1L386_9BURK|nr:hypothetical protein [Paraburkholderia caledonica]
MSGVRLARTKGLRLCIGDMRGMAQERGGLCLSTELPGLRSSFWILRTRHDVNESTTCFA